MCEVFPPDGIYRFLSSASHLLDIIIIIPVPPTRHFMAHPEKDSFTSRNPTTKETTTTPPTDDNWSLLLVTLELAWMASPQTHGHRSTPPTVTGAEQESAFKMRFILHMFIIIIYPYLYVNNKTVLLISATNLWASLMSCMSLDRDSFGSFIGCKTVFYD